MIPVGVAAAVWSAPAIRSSMEADAAAACGESDRTRNLVGERGERHRMGRSGGSKADQRKRRRKHGISRRRTFHFVAIRDLANRR